MKYSSALATLFVIVAAAALNGQDEDPVAIPMVGTIQSEEGEPVSGATVSYVYGFSRFTSESLSIDGVTDKEGSFQLEIPKVEESDDIVAYPDSLVWVYAEDYCIASSRALRGKESEKYFLPGPVKLSPATDTSFVVSSSNGEPVEGVLVEPINYKSNKGFSLVPESIKKKVAQTSDEAGVVKFPSLSRVKLFNIRATSQKYGTQERQLEFGPDAPAERSIELRPTGSVSGRIVGYKPEWAFKVKFYLETDPPLNGRRPPWPTKGLARAPVDAFGRFRTRVIAEGKLKILAYVDDAMPARPKLPSSSRVSVQAGETTELEIEMVGLVQIRGSLITADTKEPLSGIELRVYYGKNRQGTDVITDQNGEFVAMVLPGSIQFQPMNLASTNYLQLGSLASIEVSDASETELEPIEVHPSEPREGRIVDSAGKVIAGVSVNAYYRNWLCSSTTADENGEFRLSKMPKGIESSELTYRVSLTKDERRKIASDVTVQSNDPFVLTANF